ncbi:MAG: TldD/PmbA family protein [Candidatus Odinarchaeota archaeon]|nr:TldD/PmbA family protein [Candidatus Odinarchaeota archaeon]
MEDLLEYAIRVAEKLRIPYIDARGENINIFEIQSKNGIIKRTVNRRQIGLGVRVIYKGAEAYAYTSNLTKAEIERVVENSFKTAKVASEHIKMPTQLAEVKMISGEFIPPTLKIRFDKVPMDKKKEQIDIIYQTAKEIAKKAVLIDATYGEKYGKRYFMNIEDIKQVYHFTLTGIATIIVEKENGIIASHRDSKGGVYGFEFFKDGTQAENLGREVAEVANMKLKAKAAPAGKFRALIHNDLVGVLAHESFGHLTEADFVVANLSPLSGRLGEKLGSDATTIIDEGVPERGGFWLPVDDEGVSTKKTILLKNGTLNGYLLTRQTARILDMEPTGNARAVDTRYPPIPRMRNTYFAPGDVNIEEKFEVLKNGIYAVDSLGGQVNEDGTFMFKASYAYLIENGEIKEKYREVSLIGHILDFLKNVEVAFNDLKIKTSYFGGCGKGGQYPLPVGLGGPHLIANNVKFGGE